ncbi:MAG: hypothetical protein AAB375_03390 [Patescibacteria group bacterium]|mgnify:CR=1 FL=1
MTDRTIEKAVDELAVMVGRGFQSVTESMATKEDLKAYATKEDLTKVEKRLQRLQRLQGGQGGQERILEAILGVPSKETLNGLKHGPMITRSVLMH